MTETERAVRRIYDDVRTFDATIGERLGAAHLGYEILYGPPSPRPPIMFIDYQPISDSASPERPAHNDPPWPLRSGYGLRPPPDRLANRLQKVFDPGLLNRCCGLNVVFWRSPRELVAETTGGKDLWSEIEQFSMECVRRILQAVKPDMLVVLGQKAGRAVERHFGCTPRLPAGVPVAWLANVDGIPAYGMPHPSAALTNRRLHAIARYISTELARLLGDEAEADTLLLPPDATSVPGIHRARHGGYGRGGLRFPAL